MKFKDEYVLAKGWPYLPDLERHTIKIFKNEDGTGGTIKLRYPQILDSHDCPKYELVLRRVK